MKPKSSKLWDYVEKFLLIAGRICAWSTRSRCGCWREILDFAALQPQRSGLNMSSMVCRQKGREYIEE
jgi:hypothetical protein